MALVRWNPWGDVFSVQKEVNDLIHGYLSGEECGGVPAKQDAMLWGPFVDVSETDEGFIVRAELPGIGQDDVKVSVDSNTLTIKGEKKLVSGGYVFPDRVKVIQVTRTKGPEAYKASYRAGKKD